MKNSNRITKFKKLRYNNIRYSNINFELIITTKYRNGKITSNLYIESI